MKWVQTWMIRKQNLHHLTREVVIPWVKQQARSLAVS